MKSASCLQRGGNEGRIQDFQIEGAQTIMSLAAHITSAKREVP